MSKIIAKGDFRLLGICKENNTITNYVVYNEKFCSLIAVSKDTFMSMIKKHRFVNASVHNNDILCTDCDFNILMNYTMTQDNKLIALNENKIYILGYVFVDNKMTSYECLTKQGVPVDLTFDQIKELVDDNKYVIMNAHICGDELVANNKDNFISIIKTTRGKKRR